MSETKEAKSIVPKIVVVIAVIVVVLAVGIFAAFWALGNFVRGKLAQEGVSYNMSADGKTTNFSFSEEGEGVSLQAGDNVELPADYPKQLIYPNGKVVAVVKTDEGSAVSYNLDSVDSKTVQDWYKQTLQDNNYTLTGPMSDSFMAFEQGDVTGIIAITSRDGHTFVQVNLGVKD